MLKSLITQKEKSLTTPTKELEIIQIKKRLNYQLILGILFLNITTLVIGLNFMPNSTISKSDLEKLKHSLLAEINSGKKRNTAEVPVLQQHELSRLREQIREEVNSINLKYVELTEKREKHYDRIIKNIVERLPASQALIRGGVLTYSEVNVDVLRSQHMIAEDRLLKELKEKESLLLKKLDLTNAQDQKVLASFQDSIKTQMAEIRAIHRSEIRKLKEDKYLIVENN